MVGPLVEERFLRLTHVPRVDKFEEKKYLGAVLFSGVYQGVFSSVELHGGGTGYTRAPWRLYIRYTYGSRLFIKYTHGSDSIRAPWPDSQIPFRIFW